MSSATFISDDLVVTIRFLFSQGDAFSRFWLVVMILKSCEQLLEALPQTLINVIYLDRQWHNLSDWEIAKLVGQLAKFGNAAFLLRKVSSMGRHLERMVLHSD